MKKWMSVMVDDFMSTEESGDDDERFIVRPLRWRSLKVKDFFGRLDVMAQSRRSSQSRKMRNERTIGEPSNRPCPITRYSKSLLWAFSKDYHPVQSPSVSTPPGR